MIINAIILAAGKQMRSDIPESTNSTKNAPADELTLSRSKQTSLTGWQRPTKQEKN